MKKLLGVLFFLYVTFCFASVVEVSDSLFSVKVIDDNNDFCLIEITLKEFTLTEKQINEQTYHQLSLESESKLHILGAPELPKISRSIILNDFENTSIDVVNFTTTQHNVKIAPSKGNISRTRDPNSIPYTFGEIYSQNNFFPPQRAKITETYTLRNYKGCSFDIYPFTYNPVTQTLKVAHKMTVRINKSGFSNNYPSSICRDFMPLYDGQFLNFNQIIIETTPATEDGKMLVVAHPDFMATMQPFVNWKNTKGLETMLVSTSDAGYNRTILKEYISNQYYNNHTIAYVLLVGSDAKVAVPQFYSTVYRRYGASDPSYALVEGDDDYPDLYVGRFSGDTIAEIATQVNRTINYEASADGDWLGKAAGIASHEGGTGTNGDDGESDYEHMGYIRDDLLGYTYEHVDNLNPYTGVTLSSISNALNEGRSLVNYCGHGSYNRWVTTGFSNSHVNALTNDNKLPLIVSVACQNGAFLNSSPCFAEAWMRATNSSNGNPTGAIGIYAGSLNQLWNPPMCAQDEINDLLVAGSFGSVGALLYNGSCQMMDEYGQAGIEMFMTWHLFGDPSLRLRTAAPTAINATHDTEIYAREGGFFVNTDVPNAHVSLSFENTIIDYKYADSLGECSLDISELPPAGSRCELTISGFNKTVYFNSVFVVPAVQYATGLNITVQNGMVVLEWDNMGPDMVYRIFASSNDRSYREIRPVSLTSWSEPVTENKKFYYVIASPE